MKKIFQNPRAVLVMVMTLVAFVIMIDLPLIPVRVNYKMPTFLGGLEIKVDRMIGGYDLYAFNGKLVRDLSIRKGLDIAGGVSVLLDADMSSIVEADRADALNSLKDVIERRVNLLGISEASVQTSNVSDKYRIIVELAGVFDTNQALTTIGRVAQLDFRIEDTKTPIDETTGIPNFIATDLSGANLQKASVVFDQSQTLNSSEPKIQLQFNTEGAKKFKDITEQNIGKRVAIYLDGQIVIAPVVQSAILDGRAVITGQFTIDDAKILVTQLNAGALPVPVKVLEQRTIGPTLGQESVNKSVFAGIVGLSLVILFMIFYYGRLGFLASIALFIYGLVTLAIYKLVPVVLTLPGLAGFILSIGMAVDANILIFERIKEELRLDKPLSVALENGFGRSWDSIRDANLATIITAFVLFNPFEWGFLPTSGSVRGFALTLALGIFISLFTGLIITRNLVRVFYKRSLQTSFINKVWGLKND